MADSFSAAAIGGATATADDQSLPPRLFDPYGRDLVAAAHLQNLYTSLPTVPEILFVDPVDDPDRRFWGHRLSVYTGAGYLTGALAGAARGTVAGLRDAERGDSLKIRLNRVLNNGGQTGRRVGNTVGVVSLMFSAMELGINAATGDEGIRSTVAAGLGTGALYKAASGPRSAVVAGALGGIMAGLAGTGKQMAKRYVPIPI